MDSHQAHFLQLIGEDLGSNALPDAYSGGAIACLLDFHLHELQDLPEWRPRWMDDVVDIRIEVKGSRVDVFGYVVWGKPGLYGQWTDPLQAIFIRDSEERITQYELRFCDSARPSQPFAVNRRGQPAAEIDWSYHFAWKNPSVD